VVDAVGLTPTFLGVTDRLPRAARHSVALRASMIAGAILAGSALIGDWLLETRRRPIVIFNRLGNGLRRAYSARKRSCRAGCRRTCAQHRGVSARDSPDGRARRNHGNGSACRTRPRNWLLIGSLLVMVLLVAECCVAAFFFAERISVLLGMTGNIVLSRLLGVLLAALAVQYVVDGVRAVLSG